jgi:hypothetical protein
MNMQCPLCYLFFPKGDISEHATECDGKKAGKGIQKNTIAAAVAQNEIERKKYVYEHDQLHIYSIFL